jgi:putative membrane-bound dehydrogenase-like protein
MKWTQPGLLISLSTWILATSPSHAAQFKFGDQTLTVPDGFTIEQEAGPPAVNRPIVGDFDEQGRFYVADSSGSNDKVDKQLREKPHRIVRLVDQDGDGRFDRSTVFADKMMFPEGVLWHDGAVYCGAPPSIWKLEDTDDDGMADRRTEWFQGKTLTGCANDLHGPYLGLDGLIYWAKGAFAEQTHEREGRPAISDSAAHIFRMRPNGKDFDSLMSGGMDNPVDVVFTPDGEAIFTTTFYTNPEGGNRDALVHAVYGAVFPKVHGVLDGLKRTGDLMPALTHLGPAAPCGLAIYKKGSFGADFRDNLFSCQFNLHKVQRHILEPHGSTFRTRDFDFVTSDSPDFHPTDVLEDADGSLIIIDTGGWYKICCPTSQIAKPDLLGAIYRVRRQAAPRNPDPRGLKLPWANTSPAELVRRFGEARFAVCERAIEQLAKMGSPALPELRKALRAYLPDIRRQAIWTLTRMDLPAAREAVRSVLRDPSSAEAQAAAHSAGIWRDKEATPGLEKLLAQGNPHAQVAAATALGQIAAHSAVPALLQASSKGPDRFLEHALIYALLEIRDPKQTAAGLGSREAGTHRAALIALDQMDGGHLQASQVIPLLKSDQALLRETALWVLEHHREWAAQASAWLGEQLEGSNLSTEAVEPLKKLLVLFAPNEEVQKLLANTLRKAATPVPVKQSLLQVMAQAHLKSLPGDWISALREALQDKDPMVMRQALATVRSLPGKQEGNPEWRTIGATLAGLSERADLPLKARLDGLAALPEKQAATYKALELVRQGLDPSQPPMVRLASLEALGKLRLSEDQLGALTDNVKRAGPLELNRMLSAFDGNTNEAVGLKLVSALKDSPALPRLRLENIKPRLEKYPPAVQQAAAEILAKLGEGPAKQNERLEQLQSELVGGDRNRGQRVFASQKAACFTCHQIGYVGGKVGPDLSRIGGIRTERDLLEAIVYPSASFVRSYEPMILVAKDGEEYSGVLRSESADSLLLVSGAGAEKRFSREEVTDMRPGAVSVMPEGLDQQLSKQELADLVVYLKSLK